MHIVYTCLNCGSTAFIQKQPHGGAAEEEIEQEKRYADQNTEERPCPKAFGNPFLFICAEVLSGEGGNAVGQGCHTGDGKGIQLLAGRKASNNGRAIAIDGRLHEKIPDGNKALLQNTWNGDDGNLYKHFCGEGCPCNTGNAHFQPDHEENIQKNITYGGADEEIQRRTAVPQRGEDAVADIIKIQEQKPIDIDMQIEFGIGENIGRGADEAKHGTSAENADKRQNHADRNAGAEDGADSRFECAVFFCPEQAGNHNGTADIAANGNCHENHSDGVGCTDCRKRGFTDELPGNDAVCNLINLLKGNTQQHGNGKHPEHFSAAAPG